MKKAQGIILDIDGTMWDSTHSVAQAWSHVTETESRIPFSITANDMKKTMGLPMDEIGRRLFPVALSDKERDQLLSRCTQVENVFLLTHPGIPFPGLKTTLSILKKRYFLAIVSNCQSAYAETFEKSLHLEEFFSDESCWGDNGFAKAENIRLVIARNHLSQALYVGDTQKDEEETRKVGIPFVHAAYGFGQALTPDASLTSFSDLDEAAKRVFAHSLDRG